jgi:hypothetical protein
VIRWNDGRVEPYVPPAVYAEAVVERWALDRGIVPSVLEGEDADNLLRVLALTAPPEEPPEDPTDGE